MYWRVLVIACDGILNLPVWVNLIECGFLLSWALYHLSAVKLAPYVFY